MSDPLTIIQGDALSSLRTLGSESVQCVVTSPPYWSLRDYGIEPIVWDETVECEHEWGPMERGKRKDILPQDVTSLTSRIATNDRQNSAGTNGGHFCHCKAWRGCLGLEPTPELYVSHIVQIFHELKRVLRKDGTLWLNLGDCYAGGGNGGGGSLAKDGIRCAEPGTDKNKAHRYGSRGVTVKSKRIPRGAGRWGGGNAHVAEMKPKDLIGVPWRVAFALQADGWYLRSDIIWSKPNPMPESVTDRPTRSHEYVFLLSKSKSYYYNALAIAEPITRSSIERISQPNFVNQTGGEKDYQNGTNANRSMRKTLENFARKCDGNDKRIAQHGSNAKNGRCQPNGELIMSRNRRSVWTIPTAPFSEAHFATFPPDLVVPCVLAGSKPSDVVLDPFGGSGTVGKVAIELGRRAILIEPNAEYVEMIERRCRTTIGLPLRWEASR